MILLLKKKEGAGNITAPSATGNMENAAGNFAETVIVQAGAQEQALTTYHGAGDTDVNIKLVSTENLILLLATGPAMRRILVQLDIKICECIGTAAEPGIMIEMTLMMNR